MFGRLMQHLASRGVSNAGNAIIEAFRMNSMRQTIRSERPVFVKERHVYGDQIADLANLYFHLWNLPLRFWTKTQDWRDWEIGCFQMLNGDRYRALRSGSRALVEDKVPGENLWDHMTRGTLMPCMLKAAARELRRAHQFWSPEFEDYWSHSDAGAQNIIYDPTTDRARLVDFDLFHVKSMPAVSRQADDLLTLLLDLAATVSNREWLPHALSFLSAYDDRKVITQLHTQLVLPGGLAWIWWEVRTSFSDPDKIKKRLTSLRQAIAKNHLDESPPLRHKLKKDRSLNNGQNATSLATSWRSRARRKVHRARSVN